MQDESTQKKFDLYLNYSLRKLRFPLNQTDISIYRVASLLKTSEYGGSLLRKIESCVLLTVGIKFLSNERRPRLCVCLCVNTIGVLVLMRACASVCVIVRYSPIA